jgi:hypothetical protein
MKKGGPKIERGAALAAVPVRVPPERTEEKDGKLYVTMKFRRPGWQRFLGADRKCERSFGLDAYGQEVYACCDGETRVKDIVGAFAREHHLSKAEAETAVTTFLRTLMSKGLVGMAVPEGGT